MKKIWLTVLISMISLNAESLWQGEIGKSPIFMQLSCDESEVKQKPEKCYFESYFYESTLQNISLNSDYNGEAEEFDIKVGTYDKVYEKFLLKHKDRQLTGTWNKGNKSLKVNLHLYTKNKTLDEVRIDFLKFKREKVEKLLNKKELVWIKEEFSKNSFFRLGNGFSKRSRKHVNPLLDNLQKEYASGDLSCFNTWSFGSGMDSASSPNLQYLSDKLLGFNISVVYDCGGAHPDFFTARYTIDMATGKEYKLEDILSIAKDAKKIRELAFTEAKMKLEPNDKANTDTYDPYELSHWEYLNWDLTKTGIRFYLNFCSASRCYRGDYYEVSFKRLKPYLSKKFLKKIEVDNIWVGKE